MKQKSKPSQKCPHRLTKQDYRIGIIKYLAQYIPGEATLTAPLRQLLRKDMVWLWQHEHDEAIKKLKVALTNAPVLKFFDPKKQLDIQADASKDGLGACLLQDGHPIGYDRF